jgi:hypothetical protein
MNSSRRSFLVAAALAPIVFSSSRTAFAQTPACYEPEKLPLSQKSLRRSLNYLETAPDPAKKRCGLCAFFTGSAQAGCGTCALLSGAAVTAGSVCNNFAAKG